MPKPAGAVKEVDRVRRRLSITAREMDMIRPSSTRRQPHVAAGPQPWFADVENTVKTRAPFEIPIPVDWACGRTVSVDEEREGGERGG